MPINTCVFDAYGTLFDVNAAARIAANEPNRKVFKEVWPSVSSIWRMKQLQYTWLRSMTDSYIDFWSITQNSLDFALQVIINKAEDESGQRLFTEGDKASLRREIPLGVILELMTKMQELGEEATPDAVKSTT